MTGAVMDKGEGERLESARRRRFWTVIVILNVIGLLIGFSFGYVSGHRGIPLAQAGEALPDGVVVALVAGGIAAFSYGCWAFFKTIDEVELADNLWASTASFYAYAVLFPSWWVFSQAGIASGPNHWAIFFVSLAAGLVVYGYRKWRAR